MSDAEIEARIAALVEHLELIGAQFAALNEAVNRMAAYLGVQHILKDPRV